MVWPGDGLAGNIARYPIRLMACVLWPGANFCASSCGLCYCAAAIHKLCLHNIKKPLTLLSTLHEESVIDGFSTLNEDSV